jgi:hypothetical protein
MSLESAVRSGVSDSELADAIANYVSPAASASYEGLPDHQALAVTAFKDSTKFQFGNGLTLPGFDRAVNNDLSQVPPTWTATPNMAAGSTWSLTTVIQDALSFLGFWRMEWTDSATSLRCTAVGVFPTANAIIRNCFSYRYIRDTNYALAGLAGNNAYPPFVIGLVLPIGTAVEYDADSLTGRARAPASSITTHLDAPDLANQGMVASSLLGQSFVALRQQTVTTVPTENGVIVVNEYYPRMFYDWTGPKIGTSNNAGTVVQIMANDPTDFVEKPLKEDGSYDIARSQSLNWNQGLVSSIANPLASVFYFYDNISSGTQYAVCGLLETNMAPVIMCYTNVSAQASLNLRSNALREVEPEIGSPFLPFRKQPRRAAKATKFFNEFVQNAKSFGHSFLASANDNGELASEVRDILRPTQKSVGASNWKKDAVHGATEVGKAFFNPVGMQARNSRKSNVRTAKSSNRAATKQNKQNNKTQRKQNKRK